MANNLGTPKPADSKLLQVKVIKPVPSVTAENIPQESPLSDDSSAGTNDYRISPSTATTNHSSVKQTDDASTGSLVWLVPSFPLHHSHPHVASEDQLAGFELTEARMSPVKSKDIHGGLEVSSSYLCNVETRDNADRQHQLLQLETSELI